MKPQFYSLLATLAVSGSVAQAANIAFVSLHSTDNTPSANAGTTAAGFTNAPDRGYTQLLTANGHNVTRFLTVENLDAALLPDGITPVLTALQTNDLIIISRSVGSGAYQQNNETAAWNGITKPMMVLGGYITRGGTGGGSRLGLTAGETIPDNNSNNMRLRVTAPIHPIFAGLSLDSTNLMVNPFSRLITYTNAFSGAAIVQRGISVNNNSLAPGGAVLATVGTTADAAFGGPVIAEFAPGVVTTHFSDVLGGRRLIFFSGSREANGLSGDTAGVFDLQTDGATLFLNAVTYLTTPQSPKCTLPLVGATNLVVGDGWTFSPGLIGDLPLTCQWYQNGLPISGATGTTLTFTGLDLTNAGDYQLFATNATGWASSTVARLEFMTYPAADITNSIISYWPLDAALGTKTVDLVRGYDMTLVNLTGADAVPGKWGSAFQFNGTNASMERIHNPTDLMPAYQHPNFTVSLWVNAPSQIDRRLYAEGNTTNNNTLFDLGTHVSGGDLAVDLYIRSDNNVTATDHRHGTGVVYDGLWHNIVYVQRDVGNGNMRAQLWIDGVLDPVVIAPIRPLNPNTTAFGALRRAGTTANFIGLIDEVATWNRALSPAEIAILQVTSLTNTPSVLQPLVINGFKTDLPGVVAGDATTIRWDVSKDATQVTLSGVGDVTAQTSVGIGSTTISPAQTTNYVLTVKRGVDTLSSTTSVAVVTGVASGWRLLDNFDTYQPGTLFAGGYWNDTSGTAGQVVNLWSNLAARTTSSGVSFLNLRGLSVQENQARTLFFRVVAGANITGVTNLVGLTDKNQRAYGDDFLNIGSVLYVTAFTDTANLVETNGWYLGARNGWNGGNSSPAPDYVGNVQPQPQSALETPAVYNVWIDVTNAPLAVSASDTFTVYVQKEGGGPRTVLFQDFMSDRDLVYVEPVLGGIAPVLDKLILIGNGATQSATFDDFYLSTSGYNSTVPKASTFVLPPGPMGISWQGTQLRVTWSNGILQSSTNVAGPYVDVPGNPSSPLLITPTGEQLYYRSRQ